MIDEDTIKKWIVDDLQELYSTFDDDRYAIFKNMAALRIIKDNIDLLDSMRKKWPLYVLIVGQRFVDGAVDW